MRVLELDHRRSLRKLCAEREASAGYVASSWHTLGRAASSVWSGCRASPPHEMSLEEDFDCQDRLAGSHGMEGTPTSHDKGLKASCRQGLPLRSSSTDAALHILRDELPRHRPPRL